MNTGYGLSVIARALPLERGDRVLVSDKEFPANVYPWMRLGELGIEMELVPTTPDGWPDEPRLLERLSDPRVRVLAISLVQFSNGYLADLGALSAATRRTGAYLVVDGIQGVGQVPLDLSRVEVDVLACGGQKWLLSPWGSGFIYVRRELISRLSPPVTGWMAFEGTDDFTRLTSYHDTLRGDARRFELITLPYQDFAGMNASLGLIHELGVRPDRRAPSSATRPDTRLGRSDRRTSLVAARSAWLGNCLCGAGTRGLAYRALKAARVICTVREGSIRLSPHAYNTVAEMERVVDVLQET